MPPWAFVYMPSVKSLSHNQRSLVFIDGPNLYHKIKELGLTPREYSPAAIARKVVLDRPLVVCNIDFGTSNRLLSAHGNHTDSPGATRTT